MAATSLAILVSNVGYDTTISKYTASWVSVDDEGNTDSGITTFVMADLVATINARIISDAKSSHNTVYGTSFGPLTPAKLISGLV